MSITITTDVFCDGCSNWTGTETGTSMRVAEARRNARVQGWTRTREGKRLVDLCPRCQQERGMKVSYEEPPPLPEGTTLVNVFDLAKKERGWPEHQGREK